MLSIVVALATADGRENDANVGWTHPDSDNLENKGMI